MLHSRVVSTWSSLHLLQDESWRTLIFVRWICFNVVFASWHIALIAGTATPTRNASSARGRLRDPRIGWHFNILGHFLCLKLCRATSAQFRQEHLQSSFAQVLSEIRSQQSGACGAFTDPTFAAFCMDSWWGRDQATTVLQVPVIYVCFVSRIYSYSAHRCKELQTPFWCPTLDFEIYRSGPSICTHFLVVGCPFIASMSSVLGDNIHVYCQVTNESVLWSIFTWVCQLG